tara:strand:- start:443 stop:670 length:228 start_codon:yes stop_codon:yes gene_type:complete
MSTEELMALYESQTPGATPETGGVPETAAEQMPQVQATEGDEQATSSDIANQRIAATRTTLENKIRGFSPQPTEI